MAFQLPRQACTTWRTRHSASRGKKISQALENIACPIRGRLLTETHLSVLPDSSQPLAAPPRAAAPPLSFPIAALLPSPPSLIATPGPRLQSAAQQCEGSLAVNRLFCHCMKLPLASWSEVGRSRGGARSSASPALIVPCADPRFARSSTLTLSSPPVLACSTRLVNTWSIQ